jgi:hypothetical protein
MGILITNDLRLGLEVRDALVLIANSPRGVAHLEIELLIVL